MSAGGSGFAIGNPPVQFVKSGTHDWTVLDAIKRKLPLNTVGSDFEQGKLPRAVHSAREMVVTNVLGILLGVGHGFEVCVDECRVAAPVLGRRVREHDFWNLSLFAHAVEHRAGFTCHGVSLRSVCEWEKGVGYEPAKIDADPVHKLEALEIRLPGQTVTYTDVFGTYTGTPGYKETRTLQNPSKIRYAGQERLLRLYFPARNFAGTPVVTHKTRELKLIIQPELEDLPRMELKWDLKRKPKARK